MVSLKRAVIEQKKQQGFLLEFPPSAHKQAG